MAQVIVAKLNKTGKVDKVYESIATAALHEGVDASNLRKVLTGQRQKCGEQAYKAISSKQASAITKKFGQHFGSMNATRAAL
jgi:hypothetical protein